MAVSLLVFSFSPIIFQLGLQASPNPRMAYQAQRGKSPGEIYCLRFFPEGWGGRAGEVEENPFLCLFFVLLTWRGARQAAVIVVNAAVMHVLKTLRETLFEQRN